MRVAIVQNQVGIDGRSRMIGEMVVAFNEMGITPDVLTLSSAGERRKWREILMHGRAMRCEFPGALRVPMRRGYAYQTVAQNWLLRDRLRTYDLIVNSNDFVGFLPTGPRRVHSLYFPLRASYAVMPRYRNPIVRLVTSPARYVAERFDADVASGDVVLAISSFTRTAVQALWPAAQVEILYPPVDMPADDPRRERDIDVMTLGNIAPDKRQLDQLELAAEMPERRFAIVGAVMSRVYLKRLERVIRSKRLKNVQLVVDATARQVSDLLFRSRVFLHMKEEEHFGISVAQAIAHGCVPIVHDSGGQVEIVTDPALRFRTRDELRLILGDVLAGALPDPSRAREMREGLRRFTPECFRERFKALLA